ncbi:MAG: hypothetical protein M3Y60_00320 [Bacteroidota bacterium]|nr:hypothetical protein [Bacteroidota bacterium]
MRKFLLRSHLCLVILLLSGYVNTSAHPVALTNSYESSYVLLNIGEEATCSDEFFDSVPPEELRRVFKIHVTEVREEEEDHEEITCKKNPDGGKYFTGARTGGMYEYFPGSDNVISSLTAKLHHTPTFKRYLEFRVFRI